MPPAGGFLGDPTSVKLAEFSFTPTEMKLKKQKKADRDKPDKDTKELPQRVALADLSETIGTRPGGLNTGNEFSKFLHES